MLRSVPTATVWSIYVECRGFLGVTSAGFLWLKTCSEVCLSAYSARTCSCCSSVMVWVCLYVRGGQHPVYCSSAASVMIVRGNGDSSQCVISLSLGWTSNNRFLQEERDPLCVYVCVFCVLLGGGWGTWCARTSLGVWTRPVCALDSTLVHLFSSRQLHLKWS